MYRYLWAIIAAGAIIGLILFADEPVGRLVNGWTASDYKKIFSLFSKNGIFLLYAAFGGLYGYARVAENNTIRQLCLVYIKAQLVFSFALVRILKIALGRPRPGVGSGLNFFSLEAKYNSFPSGHAADVFVGGAVLFVLMKGSRWHRWRFLPLLYACLVSVARVAGGWHYPSDVVAGAAIGIGGAFFFISRLHPQPVEALPAHQR